MTLHSFRRCLTWLFLAVLSAPVAGADWYQVEIIVFEQIDPAGGNERWPGDPETPDLAAARELTGAGSGGAFTRLADNQLQLGGVVQSLRASAERRPILHWGWRQPVYGRERALPVPVPGGRTFSLPAPAPTPLRPSPGPGFGDDRAARPPEPGLAPPARTTVQAIDGSLLITRGRFLHVWTDLVLTAPAERAAARQEIGIGSSGLVQFRMQNHRRLRSGEIHYLDHPAFGLIILFTPVDAPGSATAPAAESPEPSAAAPR